MVVAELVMPKAEVHPEYDPGMQNAVPSTLRMEVDGPILNVTPGRPSFMEILRIGTPFLELHVIESEDVCELLIILR